MKKSKLKFGFQNKTDYDERPISRLSFSSGVWINGSKQTLRDNFLKYDRSSLPPSSQVRIRNEERKKKESEAYLDVDSNDDGFNPQNIWQSLLSSRFNYLHGDEETVAPFMRNSFEDDGSSWYLTPNNHDRQQKDDSYLLYQGQGNSSGPKIEIDETKKELIKQNAFANSVMISPYEEKLFQLRRQKLKLEEAYLLKLKCDEELEKTRAPAPKWYELKTKDFTVEMEKHNQLMGISKTNWKELNEHRSLLLEKSRKYGDFSNYDE